jgi:hypothetical protein
LPNTTRKLGYLAVVDQSGLPGCCGSMDVVHVKWSSCPTGNHNRAKGKGGYPSLAFQCITDFNRRILAVYGPQFGTRNDRESLRKILTFILFERDGIKMSCGIITLQKAEWSRIAVHI